MKQRSWSNLCWQPFMAIVFIICVLFVMSHLAESDVLWAVGAGSLASSCFIVFGKPSSPSAKPLTIVGGYLVGILCGVLLHWVSQYFYDSGHTFTLSLHYPVVGLVAACSIGICLFLMSLFHLEHPPAAGMALVIVVDMRDYDIIFVVLIAAMLLALIRQFFCHRLKDLA